MALACKGLNTGTTQPGFEILDKQKLGASSQQQQIAYQRGLEGEIANTISQIDGADGATVNLTLGQDNLFADECQPATAAVLLPHDASGDGPRRGQGHRQPRRLLGPGPEDPRVTITDGPARCCGPTATAAAAGGGGLPSKTAPRPSTTPRPPRPSRRCSTARSAPTRRRSWSTPTSTSTRPTDQKLTYDDKNVVAAHPRTTDESLKGTGTTSGGTSGTASNLPSYAPRQRAGGGNNDYKNKTENRPTASARRSPGRRSRPAPSTRWTSPSAGGQVGPAARPRAPIQQATLGAAGLDTERGDTLDGTQVRASAEDRRRRRPARSRPPSRASSRASGSASARCCSCSSSPATCASASGESCRRAVVAERDRGARVAGRARADAGRCLERRPATTRSSRARRPAAASRSTSSSTRARARGRTPQAVDGGGQGHGDRSRDTP